MDLSKASCAQEGMYAVWWDMPEFEKQALKICDGCPVKLDCLKWVDPANSFYDGVAGGYVWGKGRPKFMEGREDKTLLAYMVSIQKEVEPNRELIDLVKVKRFIDGQITAWSKLTVGERKEAARQMLLLGTPMKQVYELTHLRWETIKLIKDMVA